MGGPPWVRLPCEACCDDVGDDCDVSAGERSCMPPEVLEVVSPWGISTELSSPLGKFCARDDWEAAMAAIDQASDDGDLER